MLPAEAVQALGEHLDETGVAVEHGDPQRLPGAGARGTRRPAGVLSTEWLPSCRGGV